MTDAATRQAAVRHRRADEPRRLRPGDRPGAHPRGRRLRLRARHRAKAGNVFQMGVAAAEAVAREHPPRGASGRRPGRGAFGDATWRPGGTASGGQPPRAARCGRERDHPLRRDHRRGAGRSGRGPGRGATVGIVPTMGALHEGHLSLIRAARAENDMVVVSIFVNPTQFGPQRGPQALPARPGARPGAGRGRRRGPGLRPDRRRRCTRRALHLGGRGGAHRRPVRRSRPGHFRGVCTVVTKLFNIVRPDRAYFGEKDAQQLAVITRMVRDLDMRVEIVACPTVREADGLAMSSRNVRLTPEERAPGAGALPGADGGAGGCRERGAGRRTAEGGICAVLADAAWRRRLRRDRRRGDARARSATIAGPCLIALAVRFGGCG